MKTTLRQRLLTSSLLIGAAAFASPAYAQPQDTTESPGMQAVPDAAPDAQDQAEGESIVVTGSRIARRDLTSTSPLAVVQDEEFRLSGAVNVEQVVNTLPQVVPGATAFDNNPGGGVALLNLRGLGSTRNLVLVNGRRYIFYDTNQIVDLNTIPQFLIDSVDVVTGGASAVYGSDALAGVINFRLRSDLEGLIAGGQYSITEEGDGRRYNAYVALGTQFADGRGHVAVFGEYYNRGQILQADRPFSFFALGDNAAGTGLQPGGSAGTPNGRIAIPNPVIGGNAFNVNGGTAFSSALGGVFRTPGLAVPYVAAQDAYNYAPANYLMVPQERWMAGGYGEYEVTDGINVYAEVAYINNRVQNELAATPITQNVDINLNNAAVRANLSAATLAELQLVATRQQQAIAAAAAAGLPNPYPGFNAGSGAFPALAPGFARIQVNSRTVAIGSRNAFDDRNAFRVLLGARGGLTDTLDYDVYYMYSRTRNSQIQSGNISRSRFTTLVGNGTCNAFGLGLFSETCSNQLSILAQNTDISQLQVAQASVSGPLFQFGWASDPVAFAAGVEWRSMRGEFIPDTALASGDVAGFNAGLPTAGGYNAKEAFVELRVPIIQDSFIERFELNGAARYSDYSLGNVGGVWTYAVGGELSPVSDITFRAQYQRAIRAPNIEELFGGAQVGFPPATDPCALASAATNAAIRAVCVATGVPNALVGNPGLQPNPQIESAFGGNANLQEETADTWTAGVVLRPRFVPRLNITLDWYNIEISNLIAPAGGGTGSILDLCYNVIQDANSPICQAINRDAGGSISGGGVFIVNAGNANLGEFKTSGLDIQVDYSQPLGWSLTGAGESRLSFFFMANYSKELSFVPVAGVDSVNECAGRFGLICGGTPTNGAPTPKWKWTSRLSWVDGPVTTSFRWRHTGAVRDDDDLSDYVVENLRAYDLFDLSFAFDVNDNLTVNMGVNNLFDKKPQLIGDNQEQANTYPNVYDVLGRDFFISANLRF